MLIGLVNAVSILFTLELRKSCLIHLETLNKGQETTYQMEKKEAIPGQGIVKVRPDFGPQTHERTGSDNLQTNVRNSKGL